RIYDAEIRTPYFMRVSREISLFVDPPNGRIPPLTTEAQKALAADREFRLALLQATETCKIKWVTCNGGQSDPTPSSRFAERPPHYNTTYINRHVVRRTVIWLNAAWPRGYRCPFSHCLELAAPSRGSYRHPAASRCSTTCGKATA